MHLDAVMFRTIAGALLPLGDALTREEGIAVCQVAQLAAYADLAPDAEQLALLAQLTAHVCAIARLAPRDVAPVSPLPLDAEETRAWLRVLAPRLALSGVRELAYALAYVVVVSNVELAPTETRFLTLLQQALGLDEARARELVAHVAEVITPRERDAATA